MIKYLITIILTVALCINCSVRHKCRRRCTGSALLCILYMHLCNYHVGLHLPFFMDYPHGWIYLGFGLNSSEFSKSKDVYLGRYVVKSNLCYGFEWQFFVHGILRLNLTWIDLIQAILQQHIQVLGIFVVTMCGSFYGEGGGNLAHVVNMHLFIQCLGSTRWYCPCILGDFGFQCSTVVNI